MSRAILLVDDDDDIRTMMGEGLRRRGFDVETVSSGEACLDRMRSDPADMVVTDIQMPGMSGIELCAALHERYPGLPAIVVTALKDVKTATSAVENGAFALMTKPVKLEALDLAIRTALSSLRTRTS